MMVIRVVCLVIVGLRERFVVCVQRCVVDLWCLLRYVNLVVTRVVRILLGVLVGVVLACAGVLVA